MSKRIYLDNAATSWPKPEIVYQAVDKYQREIGAPAGRGTYQEASEVERRVAACRRQIAALIRADNSNSISFTSGCTEGLNTIIHGWLNAGDHVVTTVCEHNSVLRPLRNLEEAGIVSVTRIDCDPTGQIDPDAIRRAITNETRLIAANHISNVSGTVLPIGEIGELAGEYGIPLLVDAAQSIGAFPIDVGRNNIAFLAAPGHKSLYGPLGSGFFYAAEEFSEQLRPLRQGGTGTRSDSDRQPETVPEKFESGNLNVPAIIGLSAGIEYVQNETIEVIHRKVNELTMQLVNGLEKLQGVTIHGPLDQSRGSVVSFNVGGYDSREVAAMLESEFRIQVRSGFHCAPLIHLALGTGPGGSVRISPGYFNTGDDIEQAVDAVGELAKAASDLSR